MKRYPQEIRNFIAENVKGTTTKELVRLVNSTFGTDFTESKMKSYKTNHKLKSGTKTGNPPGISRVYPPEIQQFIAKNVEGRTTKELAELINKTFGTTYTAAQMRAYKKNHQLKSGLDFRFQKGNIPFNKGKKGMGGWEPTQFKKGHVPANYRPVGSERVNVYGYVEVKVADPNKWRLKHQVVWEQANGPIPEGHVVIFGDGNRFNFDINNLLLVSKGQLATLNRKGLIQKDAELTRTAIIIADVYHKISERKK